MQAEPHPGDVVGSVILPLSPGNASRQSRRSTRARPGAVAGRRGLGGGVRSVDGHLSGAYLQSVTILDPYCAANEQNQESH